MNVWSRLGLSVALTAIFSIILTESCQQAPFYQAVRWCVLFSLTVVGIALGAIGFSLRQRRRQKMDGRATEDQSHSGMSSHLLFWGPVLVAFAVVVLCVPYKPKEKVVARSIVRAPQTSAPPAAIMAPIRSELATNSPSFPHIKIQGVIYRPPNSAVIVGGHSYFVGDRMGAARVFSIGAQAVVLELNGHYKAFPVDRASLRHDASHAR